jgi:fumarate hydratase subunit beta
MPVHPGADGRVRIAAPLSDDDTRALSSGDVVLVTGTVIAVRDAAHKRLVAMLEAGDRLPFDPRGAVLYYTGPTPARPGNVIGSAGPTTASRMDPYTEPLLEAGVKAMIGKGGRGPDVRRLLERHTAVYLAALGGAGALSARAIRRRRLVAFGDLGPEAVLELEFHDFPSWVVNDCRGSDFYERAAAPWRRDDLLPPGFGAEEAHDRAVHERGALGGGL